MATPRARSRSSAGARVVHDIPGRLRLRLATAVDAEPTIAAIRELDGVTTCAWSPTTRSILVLYDPRVSTRAAIAEIVPGGAEARNGVARDPGQPAPLSADAPPQAAAMVVTETLGALDARVRRATGGWAGLGAIIPAALVAWAAREVLVGRAQPLNWSSALWYAHGLFRDYTGRPS